MGKKLDQSSDGALIFYCPGCKEHHSFYARPDRSPHNGASWDWNFDLELPSFNPSLLVHSNFTETGRPPKICHSYVKSGQIQYLTDSTHLLAGQTVEMEDTENG